MNMRLREFYIIFPIERVNIDYSTSIAAYKCYTHYIQIYIHIYLMVNQQITNS